MYCLGSVFRGCPLRWMNGWAFGPNEFRRSHRNRRGQSLVEFAIVALAVYLLLGGILTFGQLFYEGQTVQQAADVAAREISRTPLLATASLMDVLYSNSPTDYSSGSGTSSVRTSLFNPQLLQFDMTAGVPQGQSVLSVVQTWPIINQMLYPAMIVQSGNQVYGGNYRSVPLLSGGRALHGQHRPEPDGLLRGTGRQPRTGRCGNDYLGAGH